MADMKWERAEGAVIEDRAHYVVQHNGHEWRDFDLMIMPGTMVRRRLEPSYVRGRPEWIAKIVRPVDVGSPGKP
jgi:hypothetical protein